jgi:dUTP pyrophosphatase
MDLRAYLGGDLQIQPLGRAKIPTGLQIEIPCGYEAQVRPRSGLAFKFGVTVLNAPGTIDSDYRGSLDVILVNLGADVFTVKNGDRIAQLVIAPVLQALTIEERELSLAARGTGGFGSTGTE